MKPFHRFPSRPKNPFAIAVAPLEASPTGRRMVRPVGKACQRRHPAPRHTAVMLARLLDSHALVKRFPLAKFVLCGLTAVCAMSFAGPARGDEPASDAPAAAPAGKP